MPHGGPPPRAALVGRAAPPSSSSRLEAVEVLPAGVQPYTVRVTGLARGSFFYQCVCVYLLLEPTPEEVGASDHCCADFGYRRKTHSYMETLQMMMMN
uniref:Uncharacterized protein n=1 Tax=Zea mays TaxID=4577 RepID=A0A804QSC9_MAIZE